MKVEILLNLGLGWPPYKQGQKLDLGDAEAEKLLRAGLARRLDESAEAAPVESVAHPSGRLVWLLILLNLGEGLPPYKAGDVVEVPEHEARKLLALGVAEKTLPPEERSEVGGQGSGADAASAAAQGNDSEGSEARGQRSEVGGQGAESDAAGAAAQDSTAEASAPKNPTTSPQSTSSNRPLAGRGRGGRQAK